MSVIFDGGFGSGHSVVLTADLPGLRATGKSSVGRMRLSTESIGTSTITFLGMPAGSEIRLYRPDDTEAAGIESCAADQALSFDYFTAGSPANNLRVVIVSLGYKLKSFQYTVVAGNQTIPVQLDPDKWYSNP